ncbi:hypothetical protein ABFP60_07545 [Clostridioides difficile]
MGYIVSYALIIVSVFCSFKLAKEKSQNHIIWPIATALVGPVIFIVQYLVTTFNKKKAI